MPFKKRCRISKQLRQAVDLGFLDSQQKVPPAGLEPARPRGQRILSPRRLPIPPRWQLLMHRGFLIF